MKKVIYWSFFSWTCFGRIHPSSEAPETCRDKETSINYNVASSWQFNLFHDEDARSKNTQTVIKRLVEQPILNMNIVF